MPCSAARCAVHATMHACACRAGALLILQGIKIAGRAAACPVHSDGYMIMGSLPHLPDKPHLALSQPAVHKAVCHRLLPFSCVNVAVRPQPGPPEPRIMKAQALYQQKKVEEALR